MKHSGKALRSALNLIFWTLVLVAGLILFGFIATILGSLLLAMAGGFILLWVAFAAFTLYFFRDPTPKVPAGANLVVSPAHGTVDLIDQCNETQYMGGQCHRISIFLSVVNVHVQNAPVTGKVVYLKHTNGKFLNALNAAECAAHNENVMIGIESSESPGEKVGVKLIAGLIARRIVPWVDVGDETKRGERISLIQFGSRCDLYLPLDYKIQVKLGDKTVGGETIMATKS